MMMVKFSDAARFNHRSLLGGMDISEIPDYPVDDYPYAARLVWTAMHNSALRSDREDDGALVGDRDRPGHVLTGMGPAQAVRLLWPHLAKNQEQATYQAIRKVLIAESGNIQCLVQGRYNTDSKWWISDEWIEPTAVKAPRKPRKPKKAAKPLDSTADTLIKREAKESVALDKGEGQTQSLPEPKIPLPEELNTGTELGPVTSSVHAITYIIEKLTRELQDENRALRDENKLLRERITRIEDALR